MDPSHISIRGIEITDRLVKEANGYETATGTSLTYQEMYKNSRSKLNLKWRISPMHQWYIGASPCSQFEMKYDRGSKTGWVDKQVEPLKGCLLSDPPIVIDSLEVNNLLELMCPMPVHSRIRCSN
ncbi:hypothetical protein TNCV_4913281 [Trichonephila clavipes]|nr:hypothetical protein TNCV_4913281 [Trichonephila clavipes]